MVAFYSIENLQQPNIAYLINKGYIKVTLFLFRYVGINASDINHSAGRYDPTVKPPFECGFEVNRNENITFMKYSVKFNRLQINLTFPYSLFIWNQSVGHHMMILLDYYKMYLFATDR